MKLRMIHRSPGEAPPPRLPEGYRLRTLRATDREELVRLYRLGDLGVGSAAELAGSLESHESYDPAHVFVVEADDELAATAAAFVDREDPTVGFLHMVAVDPAHRGNGLGRAVTCAALELHGRMGLSYQWLLTDPWRVPAIRLYLSLGYEPDPGSPQEQARWRDVLERLDEEDR